jgi:hypothetical protein
MGGVLKYQIVSGFDPAILAGKVNALVKERFEPLGGLSVTASNEKPFYVQGRVQYGSVSAN